MRKRFPLVLVICCLFSAAQAQNQLDRTNERETEWQNYALPSTSFARRTPADKRFIFRVPTDWKQDGDKFEFEVPKEAKFRVFIEEVADGLPLLDYFNIFLESVKKVPAGSVAVTVRKTRLQDIEARELIIDGTDSDGETVRSLSWITVKGTLALTFNLIIKPEQAAEIEPYFKAIVQSVMFVPPDYPVFESLRTTHIKNPQPGPIREIEEFVTAVEQLGAARGPAISKLASVFAQTPDLAIDLLLDKRSLIRAAAVQALAQSNNRSLDPFLLVVLKDDEALVADPAARVLAGTTNFGIDLLATSRSPFDTESIARMWPFMTTQKRLELLQTIFSKPALRPVTPPPAKKTGSPVSVGVKELIVVAPGKSASQQYLSEMLSNDPNLQLGALTLLKTVSPEDFKLPLALLTAANYDPLVITGLEVALERKEKTPLDLLFKLASSTNDDVKLLAIRNFGLSANVSDIPRIEALKSTKTGNKTTTKLEDEIKLAVSRINFRAELTAANNSKTLLDQTVERALKDPQLAEFAWEFVNTKAATETVRVPNNFKVAPLAENILPGKVTHYLALPNSQAAVDKLYETIQSIQMDSARSQSNLVLVMKSVRQMIASQFGAPSEAPSVFEYTGVAANSPMAIAQWTTSESTANIKSAERTALICRVGDRHRFEQLLLSYQASYGLSDLARYSAIFSRGVVTLPALLPLIGQAVVAKSNPAEKPGLPLLKYSLIQNMDLNGIPVKAFETRRLTSKWKPESETTYVAYLGDTVILTASIEAMREVLANASAQSEKTLLASNPEFQKASQSAADVVYFSDMNSVAAELGTPANEPARTIESGQLKFINSSWLNTHRLTFAESDWAKSFQPFHPKNLTAPKELLPASTIAYFVTKVDAEPAWEYWSKVLPPALTNPFALDPKTAVLPELGPELGFALLDPPDFVGTKKASWLIFCNLKSDKLHEALAQGKLFRDVGPTAGVAEVKFEGDSYFVTVKNNFLLISNSKQAFLAIEQPNKLFATRDYSKAAEKVTGEIVAFGGYNLEAAIAASRSGEEGLAAQQAEVIFSIASAFHSQSFSATVSAGAIEAQSSVSMDREGRYGVAEFSNLSEGRIISFGTLQPGGLPIIDQQRVTNLSLKIKAKSAGTIDNLRDDIKSSDQKLDQKAPNELLLTVSSRRNAPEQKVSLPVPTHNSRRSSNRVVK